MRILFTGDSITEGEIGFSYMSLIQSALPDAEITNLGLGGDTLLGIRKRTLAHLKQDNGYDYIVVAAGHNDIILPSFEEKTFIHRTIAQRLRKRGSVPTDDPGDFQKVYQDFISDIKTISGAVIIITTLSCLNEDLTAETNQTRLKYNQAIKTVAERNQILLADVGQEFDKILKASECKNYFLDNLLATFSFDKITCANDNGADHLSAKRGLILTIDGVHINSKGAKIYHDTILNQLRQNP